MNNIREIERLNQRELDAAVPISASWHNDWNDTAYIYIGGLPYELSEGDIITIFSQYGEPVHCNLIRDKDTGKSKGFAFLKYEDQRSTTLAVDNLGGSVILGRTIRVDHTRYKPKEGDGAEEGAIGPKGDAEDDADDRGSKRRRKSESVERSPTPELLPEELELQKLILEHDEEDPMKDWLVREKKKEVEEARKKKELAITKSKSRDDKSKSKHRSHRHRSKSRDRRRKDDRSRDERKDGRDRSRSRERGDRENRRRDADKDRSRSRRRDDKSERDRRSR
ncbi:hypothetical protein BZA77DRAFT_231532, partial [Pyronema omphalodes]